MAIELWHLILAVCGGGGAILLFLQRLGNVKKGIESKATEEALHWQDIENRIELLETHNKIDHETITKIYSTVIELKNSRVCLKDFNQLKIDFIKEINRVEKNIIASK